MARFSMSLHPCRVGTRPFNPGLWSYMTVDVGAVMHGSDSGQSTDSGSLFSGFGGCDIASEMYESGELQKRLEPVINAG